MATEDELRRSLARLEAERDIAVLNKEKVKASELGLEIRREELKLQQKITGEKEKQEKIEEEQKRIQKEQEEIETRILQQLRKTLDISKQIVLEADKLRSNFVAVTGEVSDARDAFMRLAIANNDLALSFKNVQESQLALREGFSQFVFLSDAVRDSLTVQAATMDKLGVSSETTAQTLNTLTFSLALSREEALATQRSMIGLATALGVPPRQMMADFNAALPSLAKFGRDAIRVFEGLAKTARETGTSVSDLTAIVGDQMDTFEGSTRVAGRLAQAFGRDLVSGTQLLMASEEERIEILRDVVRLSGQRFEDMGKFQRIAVANAAGINDMNVANQLFNESQNQTAQTIGDTNISVEEMEELARQATDSMTQLKFAFLSLANVLQPIVTGFAKATDGFVRFTEAIGGVGGLVSILGLATIFTPGGMLIRGLGFAGKAAGFLRNPKVLGAGATLLGAASATINDGVILKNGQVIKFDKEDDVLAMKKGGPAANALGAGGGGNKEITLNLKFNNRMFDDRVVKLSREMFDD
jgi:hypothetical protein